MLQKNEIVNDISEYMLSLIPNELKTYLSFDISYLVNRDINVFNDLHTSEFLNTISVSSLLNHKLKLKIALLILLLRNIYINILDCVMELD